MYNLNRLNSKTLEAIRTMTELQNCCNELIQNPSQKAVNQLVVAIEAYKQTSDAMMNQVAGIISHFDDGEETREVQGVRDKNGIRI